MVSAPYFKVVGTEVSRIVDFAPGRSSLTIYNNGIATIYLGVDNSLSTSNGFPLPAGMAIVFAREFGDNPDLARYAVSEIDGQNIRIQEEFGKALTTVLTDLTEALKEK